MKNNMLLYFFLSGIIVFNTSCIRPGIAVCIRNEAQSTIETIVVTFTGGEFSLAELPAGEEYQANVNPTGESALAIQYYLKQKEYNHQLDVYIEPAYTGKITIKIAEDGTIDYDSDIKIGL